jgi:hypothetical protein
MNLTDMTPDQVRSLIGTAQPAPSTKIKKELLEKFIGKYNLNGMTDTAYWQFGDGTLKVEGVGGDREVFIFINTQQLPLEDGSYVVINTSQLRAMLKLFQDEIELKVLRYDNGQPKAFAISDDRISANFAIGMEQNKPKIPAMKGGLPDMPLVIKLDRVTITALIDSRAVLPEEKAVTLLSDGTSAKLVIGYEERRNTTRLTLPLQTISNVPISPTRFNVDVMRATLSANREADEVIWSIAPPKLSRLVFTVPGFGLEYFFMALDK